MKNNRRELIEKCEEKLMDMKYRYQLTLSSTTSYQKDGGEVIDMAHRELQVQSSIFFRDRMKAILPQVHLALNRIQEGTYGYCELSGEEIEPNRLLAVPWTTVSMKGHRLENAS